MFESGKYQWREPVTRQISIAVAGDVCTFYGGEREVVSGQSRQILQELEPELSRADLRLVQWEMPLSEHQNPIVKCGPCLISSPQTVDFLRAGNFDVALLANNHTGDHSPSGLLETINYIEQAGVKTVGAGADAQSAAQPLTIEKNGFKVVIFNFCETEFGTAWGDHPGTNAMDELFNLRQIEEARQSGALVLVTVHGGNEYNPIPTPRVRQLYHAFAHAGASAIVNIHTHCPQGIEVIDGVPIVYAPGNFYFPDDIEYDRHNFWWSGYLPRISFDEHGAFALNITPYVMAPEPWHLEVLKGGQRQWFLNYVERISTILRTECEHYFDIWCAAKYPMVMQWIANSPAEKLAADYTDQAALRQLPAVRHMLTCQAHCELARRTMLLLERGLMKSAMAEIPQLKSLRFAAFADQKI